MAGIFKKNDIRGTVDQNLTMDVVLKIGYCFGKFLGKGKSVAIAGDTRASTPNIKGNLIKGLLRTGTTCIDLGIGPTPMIYYSSAANDYISAGIMVTGSHNPPDQNGIKICNGSGVSYHYENLYSEIEEQITFMDPKQITVIKPSATTETGSSMKDQYFTFLKSKIAISHPINILVDFGCGATSDLQSTLDHQGIKVTYLGTKKDDENCEKQPDPAKSETYNNLKSVMSPRIDFGIVFDTDGDRVGFLTNSHDIISPDQIAMIFAEEIKNSYETPKVIMDVKLSKATTEFIEGLGGRPHLCQVGHSYIHEMLFRKKGHFAAELSGHYYFHDEYYGFDDGLYTAVRFINIVSKLLANNSTLNEKLEKLPSYFPTQEYRISMTNEKIEGILKRLKVYAESNKGVINRIDGIRVEFENSWFLARKSGTESVLSYRVEGETPESRDILLEDIQEIINQD